MCDFISREEKTAPELRAEVVSIGDDGELPFAAFRDGNVDACGLPDRRETRRLVSDVWTLKITRGDQENRMKAGVEK
jgi:hypothetical protein